MKAQTRQEPLGARASRPHQATPARTDRTAPWHARGHLPHLDQPGAIQSLTFRLVDSVPSQVVRDWESELAFTDNAAPDDPRRVELHKRIDRYMDMGHGACFLRDDRIAEVVKSALLHFDGERYRLLAWVIMPNHVHALIETFDSFPWTASYTRGSRLRPSGPTRYLGGADSSGCRTTSIATSAMTNTLLR